MRPIAIVLVLGAATAVARAQPVPLPPADDVYADTDPSALSDYRGVLDPYGQWIEDPTYGTVWIPSLDEVGPDFEPYRTAGHWEYADDDYVWVSDYPWGWLPFHYGRWVSINGVGWAWIPGRTYAPAWVDWRVGTEDWDYVGWSPTPPTWGWYGGVAISLGFLPYTPYWYVPQTFLFDDHVHHHVVHGHHADEIHRHARKFEVDYPGHRRHDGDMRASRSHHRGPPPSSLGKDVRVARARPNEPSVARARQFARPSTARAVGASPPARTVDRPAPASRTVPPRGTRPAPSETRPMTSRPAPSRAAPAPSRTDGTRAQPPRAAPSRPAPSRATPPPTRASPPPMSRPAPAPSRPMPAPSAPRASPPPMSRPAPAPSAPRASPPPMSRPAPAPSAPRASPPPMSRPAPSGSRPR